MSKDSIDEGKVREGGPRPRLTPNPPPRYPSGHPSPDPGFQPKPVLNYQDIESELVLANALANRNRVILQLMAELEDCRKANASLSARIQELSQ